MSVFNYFVEKLHSGLITFINMVTLANRDYPYHDSHSDTMTADYQAYIVGSNNIGGQGDQKKLFVSKSTLIDATTDANIRLNNSNNVIIPLRANNFYEFKSNIKVVYYEYDSEEGNIHIKCEGVLPEEQRSPL